MKRAEILDAAKKCVCGEREADYGTPESNFARIAKLWNAYTDHLYTAKDVAVMMALLKVARIRGGHKDDNFVDLAGYAACAGELDDAVCRELRGEPGDPGVSRADMECYSCRWNHVNSSKEPCCHCVVVENGAGSKWEPADGFGGGRDGSVH